MIKVSILYPARLGSRFDVGYYVGVHMPMAVRLLGPAIKAVSVEIGLGGATPGQPAPYAAIVGFSCESVEAFTAAFTAVADELQRDIPKYTDIEPVIQIGEIREISRA
jgi:uncharacterized protein (TIGR02118 family)